MPVIQLPSSRRLKYLPTYWLHGSGQVKYQAPWSGRFGFWNILTFRNRELLPRRILRISKIITLCCRVGTRKSVFFKSEYINWLLDRLLLTITWPDKTGPGRNGEMYLPRRLLSACTLVESMSERRQTGKKKEAEADTSCRYKKEQIQRSIWREAEENRTENRWCILQDLVVT